MKTYLSLIILSTFLLMGCTNMTPQERIDYQKAQQALEQQRIDNQHRREIERLEAENALYSNPTYVAKQQIELQKKQASSLNYIETSQQIRD